MRDPRGKRGSVPVVESCLDASWARRLSALSEQLVLDAQSSHCRRGLARLALGSQAARPRLELAACAHLQIGVQPAALGKLTSNES
jgi:hypothetical protein